VTIKKLANFHPKKEKEKFVQFTLYNPKFPMFSQLFFSKRKRQALVEEKQCLNLCDPSGC
jgi:hypothetical protein